jgi:hypothetical protein
MSIKGGLWGRVGTQQEAGTQGTRGKEDQSTLRIYSIMNNTKYHFKRGGG